MKLTAGDKSQITIGVILGAFIVPWVVGYFLNSDIGITEQWMGGVMYLVQKASTLWSSCYG